MPNVRNQAMMESIKADLDGVQAMWVVDACGLTVKETEVLRGAIREAGATMKVYKNTIMRKALAELELVNMDEILEGPSAFVFCTGDVATASISNVASNCRSWTAAATSDTRRSTLSPVSAACPAAINADTTSVRDIRML